jgi:uncharacterized protein
MYNMGDQTYLLQPKVMSKETIDALVSCVTRHCMRHSLRSFRFVFHGGEPLLAGEKVLCYLVTHARAVLEPAGVQPMFSMQTNGTLLTPRWAGILHELGVSVGISLDGPKAINDRQRIDHIGNGSYDRVKKGWESARQAGLEPGILTVIDPKSDPLEIYAHLKALGPRKVDFLLPQATHDSPPLCLGVTPYADWLLAIFDVWKDEEPRTFSIRLFEHILCAVWGLDHELDALGGGENEIVTIETDGAIETVDVLRVCRSGITRTSFNVNRHTLDEALKQEMIQLYHYSNQRLCATCQNCPVNEICGGGYLSHRYSAQRLFDNPSIYCHDLLKLIIAVREHALSLLPPEARLQARLHSLSFSEEQGRLKLVSRAVRAGQCG